MIPTPTLKLGEKPIKAEESLQYLGLHIVRNLTWKAHLQKVKTATQQQAMSLNKVAARSWGVSGKLIKMWYEVVTQRKVAYAASIWAANPTKKMIDMMDSLQRPFLQKATRAYRTTSTAALQVLAGTEPLALYIAREVKIAKLLRLGEQISIRGSCYRPEDQNLKTTSHHLPPSGYAFKKLIALTETAPKGKEIAIYTDGSKFEGGVGAAYTVWEGDAELATWKATLHQNNTVFQAEMYAIHKALQWAISSNRKTRILTDSMSSLQALLQDRQRNPEVQECQCQLQEHTETNPSKVSLGWVKAHAGTKGNERADSLAKEAARGTPTNTLKLPSSYVKKVLREETLKKWTSDWKDSTKGRDTWRIFRTPNTKRFSGIPEITAFLSNHGPFPARLHSRKRASSPNCVCGSLGTAEHYLLQCTLTKRWHLRPPPPGGEELWGDQILDSKGLRTKVKELYKWVQDNLHLITASS